MKKNIHYWVLYITFVAITALVFVVGIFGNPGFNIHDFCMGLATEIVGVVLALTIIDRYVKAKTQRRQEHRAHREEHNPTHHKK